MSTTKISRRYAVALFEILQDGVKIQAALNAAAGLMNDVDAKAFMESSSYSVEVKASVFKKLLSGVGSKEILSLTQMLLERGKISLLPEILSLFDGLVAQSESLIDAHVTSAVDLDEKAVKALAAALTAGVGKKVSVTSGKDESILGGVIVQVGDRKIDCSVRGKLDGMKRVIAS